MKMNALPICMVGVLCALTATARAAELKVGDPAPLIETLNHEGKKFSLQERLGKWTVLYFYPKADTPGCTKQACSFRDSIQKIRALDGEVFGISTDDVEKLSAFHKKHHLNFTLLADPKMEATEKYGTKMPLLSMAKRWTFIIGPDLKIRKIDTQVDPVKDADKTAQAIQSMK